MSTKMTDDTMSYDRGFDRVLGMPRQKYLLVTPLTAYACPSDATLPASDKEDYAL